MNMMEEDGFMEKLEETLKNIEKLSMHTYLKFLPKIELHAHLNGSLNEKTLKELGCQEDSIMKYKKLAQNIDKSDYTLQECFDVFKIAQNATKTQESVYLATKSVIEDFIRDGVVYLELRTTPRSEINMSKEEYIESVIRGIESFSGSRLKTFVKLILSIDRRHDKETSEESLRIILKMREKYPNIIKGIDFSGDPNVGEFDAALFEEARKNGLKTSIHCAEIQNDEETNRILEFGPDRIGHATYLHPLYGGSLENWDLYCKKKIPVECCLTSNVVCGTSQSYPEHHIQEWINGKLPFSINTDDKGVFSTTLSKEYELVQRHFKLTGSDLWQMSYDTIDHSFASAKEKETIQFYFTKWLFVCHDMIYKKVDPNIDDDFGERFADGFWNMLHMLELK